MQNPTRHWNLSGLTVAALALTVIGCSSGGDQSGDNLPESSAAEAPKVQYQVLAEKTSPQDSLFTLRYLGDGLETLNDKCPVRKVPLNRKMMAAYVNGKPIGFC